MSTPRLSVLMPAYRAERTIRDAVQSVLEQSLEDLELIVTDDASPVPVADVLADVRDPRLAILRLERNSGISAARNASLARARAPVIATLDADDVWLPGFAAAALPTFDDERVGLAYSNGWLVSPAGTTRLLVEDPGLHPLGFDALAHGNHIRTPGTAIRTSALRGVGGYPERLRYCEDWFVILELLLAGWQIAYVDEPLFRYHEPDYARHHYDERKLRRAELKMWLLLLTRHPHLVRERALREQIVREGRSAGAQLVERIGAGRAA